MIEAFPLHWPEGWKRLGDFKYRDASRFNTSLANARDGLLKELKLLKAKNVILSSNIPLKKDGLPYAAYSGITDTGVAVYFKLEDKNMVFACDEWSDIEGNFQSVRKTIEAIRGIKRWGASDMLERAFKGFQQIAPPTDPTMKKEETWFEILGVSQYNTTNHDISKAWKLKMGTAHPDAGGSVEACHRLNKAKEQGLNACTNGGN